MARSGPFCEFRGVMLRLDESLSDYRYVNRLQVRWSLAPVRSLSEHVRLHSLIRTGLRVFLPGDYWPSKDLD